MEENERFSLCSRDYWIRFRIPCFKFLSAIIASLRTGNKNMYVQLIFFQRKNYFREVASRYFSDVAAHTFFGIAFVQRKYE